jgi:membrane protein required for colicin V production
VNALDFLAIGCLGVFLGLGIYRGFFKSVSGLVALILALILAKRWAAAAGTLLGWLSLKPGVIGYFVVFLIFYVGLRFAFMLIQRLLKSTPLSIIDRSLGGLFGFLKGALIAVFCLTLLQLALPDESAVIQTSRMVPVSNKTVVILKGLAPQDILGQLRKK